MDNTTIRTLTLPNAQQMSKPRNLLGSYRKESASNKEKQCDNHKDTYTMPLSQLLIIILSSHHLEQFNQL